MFTRIGPPELLILLVIVVLVFGVGRLPEFAAALRAARRGAPDDGKHAERRGTP